MKNILIHAAALAAFSTAPAATFLSDVAVIEGDNMTGYTIDNAESTVQGQVVHASASAEHLWHSDDTGNDGTLMFSGSGSARSIVQNLKSSAVGSATSLYFDPEFNNAASEGTVPTVYAVQSIASYSEVLQYGGTATAYTSRFILGLSGIIQENGFAAVELTHGSNPTQTWYFNQPGSYSTTLISNTWVHGGGNQNFSLSIRTNIDISTPFYDEGGSAFGSADFGNTLVVTGVDARDQNGALLTLGSVTGDSGSNYAVMAVPEPSAAILALLAGFTLAARRRR